MKKVKPLAAVPLSKYEVLWVKPGGSKVLGYRQATTLYLGKENTIVVTHDDDTRALQEYNLDKVIAKVASALAAFTRESLNRKPQWKDKDAVAKKVERDILRTRALRALIRYTITVAGDGLELSWRVDDDARAEAAKGLGKSFLFTNRNDWTTLEIAKTYRAQKGVEDQFKELNARDRVSVMPVYHYTDQKIRAHIFISILALLLSNLLYRKLQQGGITESKEACFEALMDMKEVKLEYGDNIPPAHHMTVMSPLQQRIATILNLERLFPP
jgi:transposase